MVVAPAHAGPAAYRLEVGCVCSRYGAAILTTRALLIPKDPVRDRLLRKALDCLIGGGLVGASLSRSWINDRG